MVVVDYIPNHYRAVLARIKRRREGVAGKYEYYHGSLQTFMSLGIGSGADGGVISQLPCGNSNAGGSVSWCPNFGLLTCSRCLLVKYCSERCQRQHWAKHRIDCEDPLLDENWQPDWILEEREPLFILDTKPESTAKLSVPSIVPAADCLQLSYNEGEDKYRDFKLCFAASESIRNLVKTVNGLPKDYAGKCDILFNDMDSIAVNRNLVVLYALLSAGPSIEESAELATHLMYSAALPAASAAYLRGCIQIIYGDGSGDGDMSFRTYLKTRGKGGLISMQTTMGIKRLMGMSLSNYELKKGLKSMREVLLNPLREDDRDRVFVGLKPTHRVALVHFWRTGILAPFSLDTRGFDQPNRLLFSAQGEWLGRVGDSPLHGWDMSSAQDSGFQHGIDASDVFGCLFFHIKHELMEFARRMKEFRIDIHLTQFDPRVLSKGISIGVLPSFDEGCFDRIETSNLVDHIGIQECLVNWAPLLNKGNEYASIIMHSRDWHLEQRNATAQSNPNATKMKRCDSIVGVGGRPRTVFAQGMKSPAVLRLIGSLDAFVDHEAAFQEYLNKQGIEKVANMLGMRLRACNRIHSKRFGVPLNASQQTFPDLSKEEFYNLFNIGGAEFPVRFIEFENFLDLTG